MQAEDIKALRATLGCTARDLATALGLEQAEVLAWERGELFPTKRLVTKMEALRATGIPKKASARARSSPPAGPYAALGQPELWSLIRKLLAHPALLQSAVELAKAYPEPTDGP